MKRWQGHVPIELSDKKKWSEGKAAAYTYTGGTHEVMPGNNLGKDKADVRVKRYRMAIIKFRLKINQDPKSSQALLVSCFQK